MKAVIWTKYGSLDGLQLTVRDRPIPKMNEVLIKVRAATVLTGDCEMRTLSLPVYLALPLRIYFGIQRPKNIILGQELAGEIVEVGQDVQRFKIGDAVMGTTGFRFGAYAEYACLPAVSEDSLLVTKPDNITYAEAAAIPTGGLESLDFLRRAKIQTGQKVLINGAGGSIGTFGVQLAKYYGAEVTAVDSAEKLAMLRDIGADHVINYNKEDFSAGGAQYDVIFDVIGKRSFRRSIKALKDGGCYLVANPRPTHLFRRLWVASTSQKKILFANTNRPSDDLRFLAELAKNGKLKTIIDKTYPLAQTAEAHRYVDSGQKKGSVIIQIT